MSLPTLSVIIANYNHGHCIQNALQAVLKQSFTPLEIILIDDASTDNSLDILKGFVLMHPRARLFVNEENMGIVGAHNRGFSKAVGEYVYFTGADDTILEGFFEKAMAAAVRHPEAGVIFGKYMMDDKGSLKIVEIKKWTSETYLNPKAFLREYVQEMPASMAFGGTAVYKRRCIGDIGGFREEVLSFFDTIAFRTIGLKYGACYIPDVFLRWTVSAESSSGKIRYDIEKSLNIGKKAAEIWMSDKFGDIFSLKAVQRWHRKYRREAIDLYLYYYYRDKRRDFTELIKKHFNETGIFYYLYELVLRSLFRILRFCRAFWLYRFYKH